MSRNATRDPELAVDILTPQGDRIGLTSSDARNHCPSAMDLLTDTVRAIDAKAKAPTVLAVALGLITGSKLTNAEARDKLTALNGSFCLPVFLHSREYARGYLLPGDLVPAEAEIVEAVSKRERMAAMLAGK